MLIKCDFSLNLRQTIFSSYYFVHHMSKRESVLTTYIYTMHWSQSIPLRSWCVAYVRNGRPCPSKPPFVYFKLWQKFLLLEGIFTHALGGTNIWNLCKQFPIILIRSERFLTKYYCIACFSQRFVTFWSSTHVFF